MKSEILKTCTKCKEEKPFTCFAKSKKTKSGYNFWCKTCFSEYRKANRARIAEVKAVWAQENKHITGKATAKYRASEKGQETRKRNQQEYYAANSEAINAKVKACREATPESLERHRDMCRKWKRENLDRRAIHRVNRRVAELNRSISKGSEEHDLAMEELYAMRRLRSDMTGVEHHVDHIVPLQGKTVSGLHVPWNLQVITATENLSKSNKFDSNCA